MIRFTFAYIRSANYLAIDFGLQHIGLAISAGILAEPYDQLTNNDKAIKRILQICIDEQIDEIVVGISENQMAEITREFVVTLAKQTDLPIHEYDETLSSYLASKILVQSGANKKKRQTQQHQVAAAVILQNYLDDINQ